MLSFSLFVNKSHISLLFLQLYYIFGVFFPLPMLVEFETKKFLKITYCYACFRGIVCSVVDSVGCCTVHFCSFAIQPKLHYFELFLTLWSDNKVESNQICLIGA